MRKYNLESIGYITTFENLTRVKVKDCYQDKNNQLVFIVEQGYAGKAIGKNGEIIRRMDRIFKKKIKIIEFDHNAIRFIENVIHPLKVKAVNQVDKNIEIVPNTSQQKAFLIGRNQENLKFLQELISKYFDVEIKIK